MQLEYYGGNCAKITTKKVSIVIDDDLEKLGLKPISKAENILVFTNKELGRNHLKGQFVVDRPGEYEVLDVSIQAISARAHVDETEQKNSIVVRLVIDDVKIAVLGHIYPDLSEEQLETLGMIDILIIPVGGNGYTLDGVGALKLTKKIEPKIVIPTNFADAKLKYEVPPSPLGEVLKTMAMEPAETLDTLKIKGRDFGEGTKLVVLNRQLS